MKSFKNSISNADTELLIWLISSSLDRELPSSHIQQKNSNVIAEKTTEPHFDFEGILSVIVKVVEEILANFQLSLNPKAKGEVVEVLLMLRLNKHKKLANLAY